MKFIITTIIILSCLTGKAQDVLSDIFLFKSGVSKMDAVSQLNSRSNISEVTIYNTEKRTDENNKTIYSDQVNFVHNGNFFIGDVRNMNLLVFNNDKLWEQNLRMFFKPSEYILCSEKFSEFLKSFDAQYYNVIQYVMTDPDTNEKTGNGVTITRKNSRYQKADTSWRLDVFYNIEYDTNYDTITKKRVKTGTVDDYEFDVILYERKYNNYIRLPK